MARRADTIPVGQFWATLGKRMAVYRIMAEAKTAVEIALFSENDPEWTRFAEFAQNGGSGIDASW